jgi:hypothetical protein
MGDNANVIAWVSLALALVAGLLALLRYVNTEITQERKWREEADFEERSAREEGDTLGRNAREKLASDDQNRYTIMYRELANYKLEAAEKFATSSAIEKLQERLESAFDRLSARQETMLGRLEIITAEIAKRQRIDRSST